MSRLLAAAVGAIAFGTVSAGAVQLTLDRRAIEEAIYIGQSRIESERARFHEPYRLRVARPPIDWIDVITPFHRVELAAEMNARQGGRLFSQREALEALRDVADQIDLVVEMTFHPLNTFVTVPPYGVEVVLKDGGRMEPRHVNRFPRFGPRAASTGPALPAANANTAVGPGQPIVGATLVAALDGTALGQDQAIEVVVRDGQTVLARTGIDLARLR